jgi:hypothetical protein
VIRKRDALLAAAGLILFAFAAGRIGWGAVGRAIEEARTGVALILGLSFVRLILQTYSWSIGLRFDGIKASAKEPRPARSLFGTPRSIDWALVSGPVEATLGQVHGSVNASDHFPISFMLRFS